MRKPTKARENALKVLYQVEITRRDAASVSKQYWAELGTYDETVRKYCDRLTSGVEQSLEVIDGLISQHATNWQLKRMAVIDRNIMRIATFELQFAEDIPPKVAINEAVELAKKYGDVESSKFVNGVLDKIHKTKEGQQE